MAKKTGFQPGHVKVGGRQTGMKNRQSFDMRTLRKRILSVFDDIGGEARVKEWAEEHFDRFLLEVVIPLMPKHLDEEGLEIIQDGAGARDLVFDREEFNKYLTETGKAGAVEPAGDQKNTTRTA